MKPTDYPYGKHHNLEPVFKMALMPHCLFCDSALELIEVPSYEGTTVAEYQECECGRWEKYTFGGWTFVRERTQEEWQELKDQQEMEIYERVKAKLEVNEN